MKPPQSWRDVLSARPHLPESEDLETHDDEDFLVVGIDFGTT